MRSIPALTCVLMLLVSAAGQEATEKGFKELDAEFNAVWRAWRIANRQAAPDARKPDPTLKWLPKYQAGAKRHQGTDAAFDYLRWLVGRGWRHDQAAALEALEVLLRDHVDHAGMPRVAFTLALRARRDGFPRKKALDAQELIAKKATKSEDRGMALFWRSYVIAGTKSTDEERARALRDLETASEIGDDRTRGDAKGLSFKIRRLQIGMVAPDIDGEDLDGVAFKLSDYRGKVILLDFWGDW